MFGYSIYSEGWNHKKVGFYYGIASNLAGCQALRRGDKSSGGPQT